MARVEEINDVALVKHAQYIEVISERRRPALRHLREEIVVDGSLRGRERRRELPVGANEKRVRDDRGERAPDRVGHAREVLRIVAGERALRVSDVEFLVRDGRNGSEERVHRRSRDLVRLRDELGGEHVGFVGHVADQERGVNRDLAALCHHERIVRPFDAVHGRVIRPARPGFERVAAEVLDELRREAAFRRIGEEVHLVPAEHARARDVRHVVPAGTPARGGIFPRAREKGGAVVGRFFELREARQVRGAALRVHGGEEPGRRQLGGRMPYDRHATGGHPGDRDAVGVAPKGRDVLLDPHEGHALVGEAEIAHGRLARLGGDLFRGEEAEGPEPIVHDREDCALARRRDVLGAARAIRIQRRVARSETPTVHIGEHGEASRALVAPPRPDHRQV
mmetsp:Transcript_16123/g.49864  ORF Transcript_16123/g.49864 Transcript_16123/m.49864 type:complete len:396 (+) Transcript_16123:608-1795(+)